MNTFHRRYIFVDFLSLKAVKFKKLDKVCDKVFIFITRDEKNIPTNLVFHLQKMGKAVKWVVVEPTKTGSLNYVISFMMGRLHQQVDKMYEFAVLSNDPEFDTMVTFINNAGRSCLRVKRDKLEKETPAKKNVNLPKKEKTVVKSDFSVITEKAPVAAGHSTADYISSYNQEETEAIDQSVENTINKLVRSGNRPSNIELLRDYIMTNNHGLIYNNTSVEKVINKLKDSQEIEVTEDEVVYNF